MDLILRGGTVAAACGGVTTLIDYALPGPGKTVHGETRPCYLHFSRARMEEENGILCAGWPPLRESDQMEILWQGLESGVLKTVARL